MVPRWQHQQWGPTCSGDHDRARDRKNIDYSRDWNLRSKFPNARNDQLDTFQIIWMTSNLPRRRPSWGSGRHPSFCGSACACSTWRSRTKPVSARTVSDDRRVNLCQQHLWIEWQSAAARHLQVGFAYNQAQGFVRSWLGGNDHQVCVATDIDISWPHCIFRAHRAKDEHHGYSASRRD